MSLASPQAEARNTSPLPGPPPGGWTLLQAAEVFSPRLARIYRERSPEAEAESRAGRHGRYRFASHREEFLTEDVLRFLCKRLDLQLTGYPQSEGVHAKKVAVPFAQLETALWAYKNRHENPRTEITFSFLRNEVQLVLYETSVPSDPKVEVLLGARVEAVDGANTADVRSPRTTTNTANGDQNAAPDDSTARKPLKPTYTPELCVKWLDIRVAGLPPGEPPPSREDCYADARAFFSGPIHKQSFFKLRKAKTPESWNRQGPRGPYRKKPRK